MRRLLTALFLVFAITLVPASASAEDGVTEDDLLLKGGGHIVVAADQYVSSLVAVDSFVQIDGVVKNLVVVDAEVVVNGRVEGQITQFAGRVSLAPTAEVKDINRIGGTLVRQDGSVVTGSISERERVVFDGFNVVFTGLLWVATSIVILTAGAAFALLGGSQLRNAAATAASRPAEGFAAGILFWIAAPIAAFALVLTLVGIPLALTVLLVVLPAVFLAGYAVAGYKLGGWMGRRIGSGMGERTVVATVAGLAVLQVVTLVPIAGGLVAMAAATWGAGSLMLNLRRSRPEASPAMTPSIA